MGAPVSFQHCPNKRPMLIIKKMANIGIPVYWPGIERLKSKLEELLNL